MLSLSSISFNFLVEIPKILAAIQSSANQRVSYNINLCLLFSSSLHRRLVVRIRGKPSLFVPCDAAFVAPPCNLACTHDMSPLWHPKQQNVSQEFAVS